MKILHTSDWHLGRSLYGRKRYEEFSDFLDWLVQTIAEHSIDVLLVAGDIFDSSTPGNRAQELYYQFLHQIARSCCRHAVFIAGNHDSPSFLNAPKDLLKAFNVHVIGCAADDPGHAVLTLHDAKGAPELLVCAVPYLRDRDVRVAEAGEGLEDKERKLLKGIRDHYAAVGDIAEQRRAALGAHIPIVGMGHLFAAGGDTVEGDGVRELYIGSLARVSASVFPKCLDYVALGHLHVPQRVNDSDTIRYSGSPLPMGFGEAGQRKVVCIIEVQAEKLVVQTLDVPVFRQLESIRGDWDTIAKRLHELSLTQKPWWLEIVYEGEEVLGDLRERLESMVAGTELDILRVKNRRIIDRALGQIFQEEALDDLSPNEVFERCLDAHHVSDEQRPDLLRAYQETLLSLHDDDLGEC
ncbi:exonuclease SbcCD subunit D C-terminal domain-containing protein [Desulfovibrio sp. OttesenSCG-928-M16]|nr:exonuclease SbcCD subunit D C-terminal domain-containing protein [Desulfovibrio sp. OttesenSCG-928-M16]